jgi:hypothetical protein
MAANFPIVNGPSIPDATIVDGTVIDRQIPIIVRASK